MSQARKVSSTRFVLTGYRPQMGIEERDNASPGVPRRGLVIAHIRDPAEKLEDRRHLILVVIVHERVSGIGVDLDVVVDAVAKRARFSWAGALVRLRSLAP